MDYYKLKQDHVDFKETALSGRYINHRRLQPLLKKHAAQFELKVVGRSVENRAIHSIKLGTGPVRVLAWSQMHGNESTTTKVVFDLLNFFASSEDCGALLKKITLLIIPMLNPDGAERYTRLNANDIDLNRDAQELGQPESKVLKAVYTAFKPEFAMNLHGQRTIFGVGEPLQSATVSLLSPAQDEDRKVTPARMRGMAVIVDINEMLQEFLPNAVGRYDDSFNLNCVGDTLQHLKIPTVLFEAGHFAQDYEREQTRVFIFLAMLRAFETMAKMQNSAGFDAKTYFYIPENKKCFYDIIVRNVNLPEQGKSDIAIQYEERLVNKRLEFVPKIEKIGDLSVFKGHKEYDFQGKNPAQNLNNQWNEGDILQNLSADDDYTITFSIN